MQVPFYRHSLSRADAARVADVLDTTFLTSGPVGRDVEARLAAFFGVHHALLTSSWTTGAIATLMSLDIGPGDEVIVPAMTFIATANVVELVGATPVFVDVDPDTLMMTPAGARAARTDRTRAAIPVHLYGQMADVAGLAAALGPEVAIIEDCAHCFEGRRDGVRPGRHSRAAIFSFYATKNVTCGEGGAVISNDAALVDALRKVRVHGMSAAAADRFSAGGGGFRPWDMERLGIKANLPDLLACLLPPQIDAIDAQLVRRRKIAKRYRAAFAGLPLRMQAEQAGVEDAHHLFVVWVPPQRRRACVDHLNANGVQVTVNYDAVPSTAYYRERFGGANHFPVSFEWGAGCISLPFFPGLADPEIEHVIASVRSMCDAALA
ncbi:MAG: aminotransferase class I/II-fold pyridoxal phosphate-dependent enzyme [Alphaproteobacteria bacterium]|nr:aminotransferase class I/II-fold pyridoxal phosphate-dependent enzyme [Alphaproteobacteria bacterium]